MTKPSIVVDFAYVAPKGRGRRHLRGKLKYLQYRNDRDTHLKQGGLRDRWVDHGLGKSYRGIARSCERLRGPHVLAWTWVVSPAPDLMALIPEDQRHALLIDLTERIVEGYYTARGAEIPEYAFVLHDRLTNGADGQPGVQQLHTHVILPGTAPTVEGRSPFYNNKEKGHDRLFREIAAQHFEDALDATVGECWRELRPEADIPPDLNDLDAWFPRER